jgi:hypothetical protein
MSVNQSRDASVPAGAQINQTTDLTRARGASSPNRPHGGLNGNPCYVYDCIRAYGRATDSMARSRRVELI